MRRGDAFDRETWNKLSLLDKFEYTVNEWIYQEMNWEEEGIKKIIVSTDICYWWYSPKMDYFMPDYPYKTSHPYLGVKDWIYVGQTKKGVIQYVNLHETQQ